MSKHTKGPWEAPSAGIWTEDGKCMVASLGGRDVTRSRRNYARAHLGDSVESNAAEMETLRADLALIAAAPCLFSALRDLIDWGKGNRGSRSSNPYCVPEMKAAMTALAKATGFNGNPVDVDTRKEA